jgi:hypothetical protein
MNEDDRELLMLLGSVGIRVGEIVRVYLKTVSAVMSRLPSGSSWYYRAC